MIRSLPYLVAATALPGPPVATDYARQARLRTVVEVELDAAVTEFEMTVDGEPVRGSYSGLGSRSRLERRIVQIDEFLEHDDGRPTLVRRTFEELHEHEAHEAEDDDEDFDAERDCPLSGVTLELEADEEDDVSATLVDGTSAGSDELLEGHLLRLPLDALLLDAEEVEVGDSWELDDDAVRRALGLDVVQALFPPAGREEGGPRRRAFAAARVLRNAEWEGEVRFVEDDAAFGDLACARFEVELEASGELPEMSLGRRRDRAFGLPATAAPDNSFEIEVEGELWFALEEARPVRFELEGRVVVQRSAERERGGHEMFITSTREGTFRQEVTITAEDDDR